MTQRHTLYLLGTLILVVFAAMFLLAPIPQDPSYHLFADSRTIFGIKNFADVMSNSAFLLVGLFGIHAVLKEPLTGTYPSLKHLYTVFFIGIALTALGSGWYHLHPNNERLVWDRLPMTIAFMALFSIVIGEYISSLWARRCFPVFLLLGMSSVVYWYVTEMAGAGDLRPYALVQFLPMLLIPLILLLFPPALTPSGYYWGILSFYAGSKLAEYLDVEIYLITGALSGHSLKHLLAAAAAFTFYLALRRRTML